MPETYYYATGSEVTSIANAIRTKGGTNQSLEFPDEFVEAIEALEPQPDLTSITITPTSETQHFGKGKILIGEYCYRDDFLNATLSNLTRMSEIQAGDTCYIIGSLYCRTTGHLTDGSLQDISGSFVWQDGTNTYTKNNYTLTITTSNLSVSTTRWSHPDGIWAGSPYGESDHIIKLCKVMGDELVAKAYVMDGIIPSYSDYSGLTNMQAGDVCEVTGTLRALEAGATVSGSFQDLSGSFTWVDGTNTYTKGPYTFTITSSGVSLSHPYTGSLEVEADSNNPDGQYIIGFHKVFPYDGWNDITVNASAGANLTDKDLWVSSQAMGFVAGYNLIDYIHVNDTDQTVYPVDLSSIPIGATCYIKGSLGIQNGQYIYSSTNLEGSFTWASTNTYTKGIYTLTITASTVTISCSSYPNGPFTGSMSAPFGQNKIGFALKEQNEDGYSSVCIHIQDPYTDVSSTTATAADVISGKRFIAYGPTQSNQNDHSYLTTGSLVVQHYYTGTSDPSSSLGSNGDIYLKTS